MSNYIYAGIGIASIFAAWRWFLRYIDRENKKEAERIAGMTDEQALQDFIDRSL